MVFTAVVSVLIGTVSGVTITSCCQHREAWDMEACASETV